MFRDVPGCFGMFHVPGFIDGRNQQARLFDLFFFFFCMSHKQEQQKPLTNNNVFKPNVFQFLLTSR